MSSRWISTSLSGVPPALRAAGLTLGVHGLDERALAHAARAPQQGVVGGQAAREALGVGEQVSRMRSMPLSSASGMRLTCGTAEPTPRTAR